MIIYQLMENDLDGGLTHLGSYDTLNEAEVAEAGYKKVFAKREPKTFIFRSDLTPKKEIVVTGNLF